MLETSECVVVVGQKQISWAPKNDIFEGKEEFERVFQVEDYSEIKSVKVNPLNRGYVGVLNDRNKFSLVNLNGEVEIEKYVYEGFEASIAEMETVVNFEFGKSQDDLSRFKVYFLTYTGRIFETILIPSSFSLSTQDFTSIKSLKFFHTQEDQEYSKFL